MSAEIIAVFPEAVQRRSYEGTRSAQTSFFRRATKHNIQPAFHGRTKLPEPEYTHTEKTRASHDLPISHYAPIATHSATLKKYKRMAICNKTGEEGKFIRA